MTRKAGFSSHPESTGGEFRIERVPTLRLPRGDSLQIAFVIGRTPTDAIVGFGGWFLAPPTCTIQIEVTPAKKVYRTEPYSPNWSKFGSQWFSDGGSAAAAVTITNEGTKPAQVSLWGLNCGLIEHGHLSSARPALMKNMHQFAPEANLVSRPGSVRVSGGGGPDGNAIDLVLKSCNRCARYLPINVIDERAHLSYTNHCVANQPCAHGGFGRLRNPETGETLTLNYGFQLECRFCKKFEVNAAHNPQRTPAQMKEDGARRRVFELLGEALNGGSPQLQYRHRTGRELYDDVKEAFGNKCFKCGQEFERAGDLKLDHTRPLALLWPLDKDATALCLTHNSSKRDRPPVEFYTEKELKRLSKITGIPLAELQDPTPNVAAIRRLRTEIVWFFDVFLQRPELQKINDGKLVADLVVKALQKTINRLKDDDRFDLLREYRAVKRS